MDSRRLATPRADRLASAHHPHRDHARPAVALEPARDMLERDRQVLPAPLDGAEHHHREIAGLDRVAASAGADFSVDHAPLVSAPSDASGKAGTSIQVQLTAQDPDGDSIRSLTAESIAGSTFSVTP